MKSNFIIALWLASFAFVANAQSEFRPFALDVLSQIKSEIQGCGLSIQPFTPLNPNDTHRAIIVGRDGRYLAWYGETGSFAASAHEFRDYVTNGYVHRLTYSNDKLQFLLPTRGVVATVNTYMYGLQRAYTFRCYNGYVPSVEEFRNCVYLDFTLPIVQQLCNA